MIRAHAIAPAKAILFGEHFVVHGALAIAAAINLCSESTVRMRSDGIIRVESLSLGASGEFSGDAFSSDLRGEFARRHLEPFRLIAAGALGRIGAEGAGLDISINSKIPIGVGLGSSAATAISTIAAIAELFRVRLRRDQISGLAFNSERYVHGRPSGIDQTTSTFGGLLSYKRGQRFARIKAGRNIPLVVGNTGVVRSTGEQVSRVSEFIEANREISSRIMKAAEEISEKALRVIRAGNPLELGLLMNQNHELLQTVGASSFELDKLVEAARSAGALGAKLTGAGGGGCMVAITKPDDQECVADAIKTAGGEAYIVRVDKQGVRSWLEE